MCLDSVIDLSASEKNFFPIPCNLYVFVQICTQLWVIRFKYLTATTMRSL